MHLIVVELGVVTNIVLWDGRPWTPPAGAILVAASEAPEVAIGWLYDGQVFTAPPPEAEPES